jgi:hypothetical protein
MPRNFRGLPPRRLGRFHSCAADAAGNLFCAGKNDLSQLGLGDTERPAEVTRVPLGG